MSKREEYKKMKKTILGIKLINLVLALCLFMCVMASCSPTSVSGIEGEWYRENGKRMEIFLDATYKCEGEYGTGKWKKLDNGKYQLIDFYGDDTVVSVEKDEYGTFINYNGKTFYKDEYPKIDTSKNDTSNQKEESEHPNVISLEPFEGIEILVSGISPYCIVTVNNQNCSSDVQNNVEYNLDKSTYANGDTVTITALLNNSGDYVLSSTIYTYSVKGQPEYVTSLKDVDLTELKAELADYISAGKAAVVATSKYNRLFSLSYDEAKDKGIDAFTSCDSTKLKNTYFSSLKSTKLSNFSLGKTPFNQISFIYEMDYSWIDLWTEETGTGTAWFNISACNLVKYPDGSIKWGNDSIGAFDFNCEDSTQGVDSCVTATVTVDSVNYNISKID